MNNLNYKKKTGWLLIKIIIAIALLSYVFSQVKINTLLSQLSHIKPLFLSIALLLLLIQIGLSSLKWQIILASDVIQVPYRFLLKSYFICNFISLFLPTSFGGDVYRVYSLKKYNADMLQNTSSVLFDRITGMFALSSIAVISYSLFHHGMDYRFPIIYGVFVIFFLVLSSDQVIFFLENKKSKIIIFGLQILRSFSRYKNDSVTFSKTLLISFLFQNNIIWVVKLYCLALDIHVNLGLLYIFVPLIYATEALPITINGLGVRESAFVFFFLQIGRTAEEALAVSLLVIGMRYLISVSIGGSLFLGLWFSKENKKPMEKIAG